MRDTNDTALIASAFLPQNPNAGQNKFFEDAARAFLEGMITIAKREGLSMVEMYKLISSDTSPDPQAEDQTDGIVNGLEFVYEMPGKVRQTIKTTGDDEATGGGIELVDCEPDDEVSQTQFDDIDIPASAFDVETEAVQTTPTREY